MSFLNKKEFDIARYESTKVNKYGLVEYGGCRYSASPQMIEVTYKRLKENLFTYHQQIDVPVDLPHFTVDVSGYDKFMSKSKNLSVQGGCH